MLWPLQSRLLSPCFMHATCDIAVAIINLAPILGTVRNVFQPCPVTLDHAPGRRLHTIAFLNLQQLSNLLFHLTTAYAALL